MVGQPCSNLNFRRLFEFLVLCCVSGSWALYKNGLLMTVAQHTYHAHFQSYIVSSTVRRTHRPALAAALSWQSVRTFKEARAHVPSVALLWQSVRTFKEARAHVPSVALLWQSAAHSKAAKPYSNLTFRRRFEIPSIVRRIPFEGAVQERASNDGGSAYEPCTFSELYSLEHSDARAQTRTCCRSFVAVSAHF
jgi:hypothetical protein